MHQCTHCQAQLPESAQFCSRCGAPVPHEQDQPSADTDGGGQQPEEMSLAEQEQSQAPIDPPEAPTSDDEPVRSPEEQFPEAEPPPVDLPPAQTAESAEPEETSVPSVTDEAETPAGAAPSADLPAEPTLTSEQANAAVPADAPQPLTPTADEVMPSADLPAEPTLTSAQANAAVSADAPQLFTPVADETAPSADLPAEPTLTSAQRAPVSVPAGKRFGSAGRRWLVGALLVLLVVATGAGIFALLRQQASPGVSLCNGATSCAHPATGKSRASATELTFVGSVSGPLTISAQVRCQTSTIANLRTLMVTLSGTVGERFYNFGFVITHYNGPGTYHTSLTILLDVPGDATNNGWGNMASTDDGTITITRGEQTGNITYTLSGFGTRAGTQVQVSGAWVCG